MVGLSEALSFPFVVGCFEVPAAVFRRFDELWLRLGLKISANKSSSYLWSLVWSLHARACHGRSHKKWARVIRKSDTSDHFSTYEPAAITPAGMEEVPPTCFVIRPHHIQNLMIIGVVFQEFKDQKIPPQFVIHVYRLLMQEIAEVSARQYALSVSVFLC